MSLKMQYSSEILDIFRQWTRNLVYRVVTISFQLLRDPVTAAAAAAAANNYDDCMKNNS